MVNQMQDAPLEYYSAKYRAIDPEEATIRTGCPFDAGRARFTIKTLGHTLYAAWPEFDLVPEDSGSCPGMLRDFAMQLLTMQFLISGVAAPSSGAFKAYRELPWGEVYDSNFTGRCIKRFAYGFGFKPEKFAKAAEELGGVKLELGDMSYDLPFLGGVICRLILWMPDEEFPPSAQFLFSDNTQLSFNAEALAGVGDVVISALKQKS
jgi:hypothetical protein